MPIRLGNQEVILKRGNVDVPALYRANFRAFLAVPPPASASGGTETYYFDGTDFWRIHTFTDVGGHTLSFSSGGDVEYLVVAGGGSGGDGDSLDRNSGGGAGGFRTGILQVQAGSVAVTVGDGGAYSSNGEDSTFATITSTGGGRGGPYRTDGGNGGSGGGGGGGHHFFWAGGLGNVPATDPPQGNDGGRNKTPDPWWGGGGGGAGGAGVPGDGGSGLPSDITGVETFYAGGGGSSININVRSYTPPRPGGVGGGGDGGNPGLPNTGGGGGGDGKSGGSGIVVVRYKITEAEYLANT